MTFDIWIGLWQKYFYLQTREAFKSLVLIGYCGKMRDAITLKKYKARDLLRIS